MGEPVKLTFLSPGNDYCFTSWDEFFAQLNSLSSGETVGESSFFNDGDTTPAPDAQGNPWTPPGFSGANPPAFIYHFVDGVWIMPHPMAPGLVVMYEGTEASITTYDGGEAGAITATTGPMWEKVTAMDARVPLGPGTLNAVAVAVGTQGGAATVTLLEENLPVHVIQGYAVDENANLPNNALISDDDRVTNATTADSFGGEADGSTRPTVIIPPYTAIWFIRRTQRKFYRR